jgi:hypothetical protein
MSAYKPDETSDFLVCASTTYPPCLGVMAHEMAGRVNSTIQDTGGAINASVVSNAHLCCACLQVAVALLAYAMTAVLAYVEAYL